MQMASPYQFNLLIDQLVSEKFRKVSREYENNIMAINGGTADEVSAMPGEANCRLVSTRQTLRHDSISHWLSSELLLLDGEPALSYNFDPITGQKSHYKMKIGKKDPDGTLHSWKDLPFLNVEISDVIGLDLSVVNNTYYKLSSDDNITLHLMQSTDKTPTKSWVDTGDIFSVSAINDALQAILSDYTTSADVSAIVQAMQTSADFSQYYKKSETSSASEISAALDAKRNILDLSAYVLKWDFTPFIEVKPDFPLGTEVIAVQDVGTYKWRLALTLDSGTSTFASDNDLYSTKAQAEAALEFTADNVAPGFESIAGITVYKKAAYDGMIAKVADVDIARSDLCAYVDSKILSIDISDYYKKVETSSASELSNAFGLKLDVSGDINENVYAKSINAVSELSDILALSIEDNVPTISWSGNSTINAGKARIPQDTFTIPTKVAVNNRTFNPNAKTGIISLETLAHSININGSKAVPGIKTANNNGLISFGVPTEASHVGAYSTSETSSAYQLCVAFLNVSVDLSEYYKTSETSSKTELANEFNKYQLSGDYAKSKDVVLLTDIIELPNDTSALVLSKGIKSFVNSSINNMAAFYVTRDANGNAFLTYNELSSQVSGYNAGQVRFPTKNDYAIVLSDEAHYDNVLSVYPTTRYTFQGIYLSGGAWQFLYVVNNTALTLAQADAINSEITKAKVLQIATNASNIGSLQSTLATDYYKKEDLALNANGTIKIGPTLITALTAHQILTAYYPKSETSSNVELNSKFNTLSTYQQIKNLLSNDSYLTAHLSLSSYYTKSETSAANEINAALSSKLDSTGMSQAYDASKSYKMYEWMTLDGMSYRSLSDDNTGHLPTGLSSDEWWEMKPYADTIDMHMRLDDDGSLIMTHFANIASVDTEVVDWASNYVLDNYISSIQRVDSITLMVLSANMSADVKFPDFTGSARDFLVEVLLLSTVTSSDLSTVGLYWPNGTYLARSGDNPMAAFLESDIGKTFLYTFTDMVGSTSADYRMLVCRIELSAITIGAGE